MCGLFMTKQLRNGLAQAGDKVKRPGRKKKKQRPGIGFKSRHSN